MNDPLIVEAFRYRSRLEKGLDLEVPGRIMHVLDIVDEVESELNRETNAELYRQSKKRRR